MVFELRTKNVEIKVSHRKAPQFTTFNPYCQSFGLIFRMSCEFNPKRVIFQGQHINCHLLSCRDGESVTVQLSFFYDSQYRPLLGSQQIMFQLLLKATNPNQPSSDSNKPQPTATTKEDLSPAPFQKEKILKSPLSKYKNSFQQPESVPQTPAFLHKLQELGHDIEFIDDEPDVERDYQQPSEKVSQVISVNEMTGQECHPMILSNFHSNSKQTLDKLSLLKIRNEISQLRQVQLDLMEYLQDQKRLSEDFQDKIGLDIEDFFIQFANKMKSQQKNSKEVQNLKDQISKLKATLDRNDVEREQHNHQIEELKKALENQKGKAIQQPQQEVPVKTSICKGCKSLELRVENLKEEMAQNEQNINELLIENERLQEYIFDIQQKIVGVDLEVQRKVKQRLRLLPPNNPTAPPVSQKGTNIEEVGRLTADIQMLRRRCKEYEQKSKISADIQTRLARIEELQFELQSREEVLKEAQVRSEQMKQATYEREHQMLEAEDNLSKKIADLRDKEAELSSWETELIRQANQTRPALNLNFPSDELGFRINSHDQLNNSRQMSLKSFGRAPHHHATVTEQADHKPSPRRNYTQQQIQTFNPHEQLQRIRDNRYEGTSGRWAQTRKNVDYVDNGYASKASYHNHNNQAAKNMKLVKSNYRDYREASPYRGIEARRGHPQGGVQPYRDVSKNSRSSVTKSLRGGYGVQTQPIRPRGETPQISGLSNKLQRLREQIKKEIDSIK